MQYIQCYMRWENLSKEQKKSPLLFVFIKKWSIGRSPFVPPIALVYYYLSHSVAFMYIVLHFFHR